MITAPSAFKDALGAGNRNYQVLATVTLTSGSVLTLDNSVIWASGFSFEDAISTSADTLDIGAAIINQATLVISNMDEQFSDYDFDGATVAVQIGLRPDEESSVSYINKGTFTVGKTAYNGTLITLTCLDNMSKFDKVYASPLTFPTTAITVVQDACQACGVTLAVNSFDGDTTSIPQPPAEAVTYRQMLVWIGQMVGCCWRINNVGELAPVWYNISVLDPFYADGGTFAYDNGDEYDGGTFAYDDGDSLDGGTFAQQAAYFSIHSASSESVAVDDTIVTGVKIIVANTAEDAATAVSEYTTGTDGYVLTIEGNPLITADNVASILSALGSRLIGMTYRKGMVSHINDPRLEAGDVFVFTDHKGHVYPMICSETSFTVGEYQHTTSASETPARNSAQRYSESTRNTVKIFEAVGREKNARETAVDDLQDQIDNAPGLYMTTQTEGGATVYLLHNKPTVAASNIIWKMSSAAVGVSTNGGQSYNAGLTADGTAIVQRLYANAVTAGILQSADYQPPASGSNYSTRGMIVDLNSQVIRTPKTAILSDGSIYSSSVDLEGKITATSGDIGPWTISSSAIYNGKTALEYGNGSGVYIGSDGIGTSDGTYGNLSLSANGTLTLKNISADRNYAKITIQGGPGSETNPSKTEISYTGLYVKNKTYSFSQLDLGQNNTTGGYIDVTGFRMNTGIHLRGDNYGVGYPAISLLAHGDTSSSTATNGGLIEFCFNSNSATAKIQETSSGVLTLTGSLSVTNNLTVSGTLTGHASLDLPLTGGTLTGAITLAGYDINLGTNSTASNDSGDIAWLYGNGTEKMRIWTDNVYTAKKGPNYRVYDASGTALYSGQLVTTDGTGASGKWDINITGHADGDLALSGGTMTGALRVASTVDANTVYVARIPSYTKGTAPSSEVSASVVFADKDGWQSQLADGVASIYGGVASNGDHYVLLRAISPNTSTVDWRQFVVYYPKSGTPYASLNCTFTVSGTLTGYDYSGASHVMVGSAADASHRVGYLYHQNPTTVRVYGQAGGSGYTTYTTLTGSSSSDIRLKEHIKRTDVNALSLIRQIEMKAFDWKPGWRDYTYQPIGMIADQIEKLDSRLVIGGGYDPDGEPNYKVIDDHYLSCYLTKGIQELCAEIENLKERIRRMEAA